jgi:class 3 adenylate cyclase
VATLLFLGSHVLWSQSSRIDSLKNEVQTGQQDTTRVVALNALSLELIKADDLEQAKEYADQSISLAEELDFKKGKAYALKNKGLAEYYLSHYKEVLENWTQSLQTFEAIQDTLGIANLSNNLGLAYFDQGSFDKALSLLFQSLRNSEKIKDTVRINSALVNIGGVYTQMNEFDKALSFYQQMEQYLPNLNDTKIRSTYLMVVGEVYSKKNNSEKALEFYNEALALNKDTPDYAHILTMIGKEEQKIGNVQKAIDYFDLAYQTAKASDQPLDQVQTLLALGNTYNASDPGKALGVYKNAERLAIEIETDEELRDIYQGMAMAYETAGDYKNAYAYQDKYLDLKDKIFNIETDDKIRGLQYDFEIEKEQDKNDKLLQEAQITDLQVERQQYVIYGGILSLILVLVLAVGSYKRYRFIKKTNKIIETEKDRSENLLRNILPDETALELKEHGKVKAKKFESVTVMFTDFKGFTSYSASLSPEELVRAVDFFFSKFDAVMDKYGLEKIKTIGDAYMCAGGLPFPTEDHHLKVVEAGFEIAQIMEEAKKSSTGGIMNIDVRIGINTGPVVSGVVGTRKFAYDIWGDAVNVASRMETMSEPGRINVSENTFELIKDVNIEDRYM